MKVARVYDVYGTLLRELVNVSGGNVLDNGTLVFGFVDAERPGALRFMTFSHGTWAMVEEWSGDPGPEGLPKLPSPSPTGPAGPRTLSTDVVDVYKAGQPVNPNYPTGTGTARVIPMPSRVPGETVGIMRDPLAMSNTARLREALQIHCACDALRCPMTWPSPTEEGATDRCDQLAGHDHVHGLQDPTRWLWGPHNHHEHCPRFPGNYNRHTGPCAYQRTADGVPIIGEVCALPWGHDGEHQSAEGQPAVPAGSTARGVATLPRRTRAVPTAHTSAAVALRAAGLIGVAGAIEERTAPAPAAPVALTFPTTSPDPLAGHWFKERQIVGACGTAEPTGLDVECERDEGHDGLHAHFKDRTRGLIQW